MDSNKKEAIFSITGAGSYFTRKSADRDTIKQAFINQLKKYFYNDFTKHPLADPYLYFAKICLDNNGNIFAITCIPYRPKITKADGSKIESNNFHKEPGSLKLTLTAFTISATGTSLYPLCMLQGLTDAFKTEDGSMYGNKIYHKLRSEKECHIGQIASLEDHFENHGIGRELMLFWQELCHKYSTLSKLTLAAINVQKNVPWYQKFGFKVDEAQKILEQRSTKNIDSEEVSEKDLYDALIEVLTSSHDYLHLSMDIKDIYEYATNKARRKSEAIFDSASEETQNFVAQANKEINDYIKELRNSVNGIDLSVRRGELIELDPQDLPFDSVDESKNLPKNKHAK